MRAAGLWYLVPFCSLGCLFILWGPWFVALGSMECLSNSGMESCNVPPQQNGTHWHVCIMPAVSLVLEEQMQVGNILQK